MGVVHLRIPGGTTSVLQAADRPTTNFRLKALLRKHMRRHRIKAVLKGEFGKDPTGLTVAAREKISVILSAVRDEWRATPDYSEGIKRAFDETVLCRQPGNTPNKALGKLIETRDALDRTPLLCAAYIDNLDVCKCLIEAGANVLAKDNNGETADELTDDQFEIYKRNWLLMDLKKGYNYYDDEVPAYEEQLEQLRESKCNFSKFLEQAKELNLWSIVRNYTSWRKSFDNNEHLLNTINKAIQNAST